VLLLLVTLTVAACSESAPATSTADVPTPEAVQPTLPAPQPGLAGSQTAPQTAPQTTPQTAAPVPAALPDMVARVNGDAISRAELEQAIGELEARAGQPVPAEQRDQVYRGVLDQIVGYRLLVQESAARTIAVTDTELDARVAEIRQQFDSEEAFQQLLAQRKLTVARLRTDLRDGLRIDRMLETRLAGTSAVTPQQVSDFYQQNPSQFQQGERVRASHILIPFPENADAAAREQARAQAAAVLEQVKAGTDFAALARQHSQDPGSAGNGGDLGFFERGQMVGPFDEAAFSLQPAQTSELVETEFGYHIIRVAETQPARAVPLDEVRPQIQQFLDGQAREQQVAAFVESLKARGQIEIFI
jgi:peptidyl-prolyl cis-trans isomerase C